MEHFSLEEKYQRSVEIGVDQFGGQSDPTTLLDLVGNGTISEARIDQSTRRILRLKFELGLFDNPYVDETEVINFAHVAAHREAGLRAQRESTILLTNKTLNEKPILPLSGRPRIYSEGLLNRYR